MEFETPGLVKLVPAFADNDLYEEALFDDIADGITYCNHFFSPMHASVEVGGGLAVGRFQGFSAVSGIVCTGCGVERPARTASPAAAAWLRCAARCAAACPALPCPATHGMQRLPQLPL